MRSGLIGCLGITALLVSGCATPSPPQRVEVEPFLRELPKPLTVELPFFRAEKDLRAWGDDPSAGRRAIPVAGHGHQNMVVTALWGSGIPYQVIYLYNYDVSCGFWSPAAFWTTRTQAVTVEYSDWTGKITIRSKTGRVILTTDLEALESRVWTDK